MRIAVLSDMVRPNGAGVMALLAADLLSDSGHEVVILGGAMDADLERQLEKTHRHAAAFTNDERALDGSVTPTQHVAFVRSFRKWLDQQLHDHTPDVLYVHNCGRVLSQLDLADLSQQLPVVHTMHDEWFYSDAHYTFRTSAEAAVTRTFEPGRSESVIEHRYDHLFNVPSRAGALTLLGPSFWITRRAETVFPTLDIQHVPNAVDTSLFDLQDRAAARAVLGLDDRPMVLFVGSPTQERKGFMRYERALRHVARTSDVSPLRVVAGGSGSVAVGNAEQSLAPGPILDLLAQPTASPLGSVGIEGDGIVLSGLRRSLMPALYGAADLLVHPSVIDNLPTVPIEAGLCGTRCLASNVGGTRETIADQSDLFDVDISDAELGGRISDALAAVSTETEDDRMRRRTSQLGRFDVETHSRRLLPILERLVTRGTP